MRIVSLLPSATEIVCALGLGDSLVGVSHECDWPPEIVGLPVVTEAKIDVTKGSADIDAAVRGLVREGLSVYRIRTDVLAELKPDLVVTQEQCDVCAVSYAEVVQATRELLGESADIVSLKPVVLRDIFSDIERVAEAAGRAAAGRGLVAAIEQRFEHLRERATRVRNRPRVACIEWLSPLMTAGNWVPELVTMAGGAYNFGAPGDPSATIGWDKLREEAPDVVILMPCGFKLPQTERELPQLTQVPDWRALPAVRNGRVYAIDGNSYVNRPGPRIAESGELLAGLIQPGFFASLIPPRSYTRVE
jgi:iron complex transport system substrate-binding protein